MDATGGRVVRVVTDALGCPPGCTYRVERADLGSSTWTRLAARPLSGDGAAVVLDGTRIYVAAFGNPEGGADDAHARMARSVDDGVTWQQSADPCGAGPDCENDLRSLAAAQGGVVAGLCRSRISGGAPFVVTSADGGATFGPRRTLPLPAVGAQLVSVASSGVAVAYGTGPAVGVLVSRDGGATRSSSLEVSWRDGPQVGWFLGFQENGVLRASFGDSSTWASRDRGVRWERTEVTL